MNKLRYIFLLVMLMSISGIQAQKSNVGDAKVTLGLSFDVHDVYSPAVGKYTLFKNSIDFGPRLSIWYNPNASLAITGDFGVVRFRTKENELAPIVLNRYLFDFTGGLAYKFNNGYILKEDFPFAPYVLARVQGSIMRLNDIEADGNKVGIGLPIGLGFNIKVANNVAVNLEGGYTVGMTPDFEDHIFYSLGMKFDLGKSQKKNKKKEESVDTDGDGVPDLVDECPDASGVAGLMGCPDADGDGVADGKDRCPNEKGLAKFNGCPDTDGDGVPDKEDNCPEIAGLDAFGGCLDSDSDGIADPDDECPNEPGLAKFNGCLEPDSDNDGIGDSTDECPNEPGTVALEGCPDKDADGVADKDDKCPELAGAKDNQGCPKLSEEAQAKLDFAASSLQFETGSGVIKSSSFKILNEVVMVLKAYPAYYVSIEGHTDNVGTEEGNQELSEKRAKAAATYLVNNGIAEERVSSAGFGEMQPIADNGNLEGRKKNRRVEFKLFLP